MTTCICLCKICKGFDPGFDKIVAPLIQRLKKEKPADFELNKKMETSSNTKRKLLSQPMPVLRMAFGQFIVDYVTRRNQLRCAPLQHYQGKVLKPIGYCSGSPFSAKHNSDTKHKECQAIIWFVLVLCLYLEGTRFAVPTNQQALL